MAEIIQRDGSRAFDGAVRITPGPRSVSPPPSRADHHDVLLRRLRGLGRLHRDGLLTDEEFAMTKAVAPLGYRRRETRILDPGARPGS